MRQKLLILLDLSVLSINYTLVAPIKFLYRALVHSVVEYASVLLVPHTINHSYLVERVQFKLFYFARYILITDYLPHDISTFILALKCSFFFSLFSS